MASVVMYVYAALVLSDDFFPYKVFSMIKVAGYSYLATLLIFLCKI